MDRDEREKNFRQHLMLFINDRYSKLPEPEVIVDQLMEHYRISMTEAEQRAVAAAWTIPLFG
jgi:hypothetical protein